MKPARLVTLTLTGGRGRHVWKGEQFLPAWEVSDRDVDAALIAAYIENVGHAPRNDGASEQWRYNPRSPRYRGRAHESRVVIVSCIAGVLLSLGAYIVIFTAP